MKKINGNNLIIISAIFIIFAICGNTTAFAEEDESPSMFDGPKVNYTTSYDGPEMMDLDYGTSQRNSTASITSYKFADLGNQYAFEISYTSPEVLNLSVFNPPDGDIYLYLAENIIEAGSHKLYFYLSKSDVESVNEITINLFKENKSSFAFFSTEILNNNGTSDNPKRDKLTIVNASDVLNLTFEEAAYIPNSVGTFEVKSFKRASTNDNYVYELKYNSLDIKGMSFFNPPDGEGMMYIDHSAIQPGNNTVYFAVPKQVVDAQEEITMSFFNNTGAREFIFIMTGDDYNRDKLTIVNASDVLNLTFEEAAYIPNSVGTFEVKSFKRASTNTNYVYELKYNSLDEKGMSFFNPPDGDGMMYIDHSAIKTGNNTVYFAVPKQVVDVQEEITMSFFNDTGAREFIFIMTDKDTGNEFNRDKLTIVNASDVSNLTFEEAAYIPNSVGTFEVKSFKRASTNDNYVYELKYNSLDDKGMSFFDPPDGEGMMYIAYSAIKSGNNTVYFAVSKQVVDVQEEITMSFFNDTGAREFIFIMTNDDSNRDKLTIVNARDVLNLTFEEAAYIPNSVGTFEVKSFKRASTNDNYVYELKYNSLDDKGMSFFNPPDGDGMMYIAYSVIQPGDNTVYFAVPKQVVDVQTGITMSFFNNTDAREFLFVTTGDGIGDDSERDKLTIVNANDVLNLTFEEAAYIPNSMGTFEVKSFKRASTNDNYVYELKYNSQDIKGMSFFNPPDGDGMMYIAYSVIQPGDNTVYFAVPKQVVDAQKEIAMSFFNNTGAREFIFWVIDFTENELDKKGNELIEVVNESEVKLINFENKIIPDGKLENQFIVNELFMEEYNDFYYFKMNYTNDVIRRMAFFNPPDGDVFVGITAYVIEPGTQTIYFKIQSTLIKMMKNVTIGFNDENGTRDWIYIGDLFNNTNTQEDSIELQIEETQTFIVGTWNEMIKKDSFLGYDIYRYENNDKTTTIKLANSILTTNKFIDADVEVGQTYSYYCVAVDKNNSENERSNIVDINVTITNNRFAYNGEHNQLLLQLDNEEFYNNSQKQDIDTQSDAKPFIRNNRTMVPIRAIVENIGGEISWNGKEQIVTIIYEDKEVSIYINDGIAVLKGEQINLENPPEIIDGRTYLPLRFVLESLDLEVNWDGDTKVIQIIYN